MGARPCGRGPVAVPASDGSSEASAGSVDAVGRDVVVDGAAAQLADRDGHELVPPRAGRTGECRLDRAHVTTALEVLGDAHGEDAPALRPSAASSSTSNATTVFWVAAASIPPGSVRNRMVRPVST